MCVCVCVCFAFVFCLVSVLVSCSFTCYTMLVILILLRLATYILNSHCRAYTCMYISEESQLHLCVGTQELQERYRLTSAPKIGKRCPMGTGETEE